MNNIPSKNLSYSLKTKAALLKVPLGSRGTIVAELAGLLLTCGFLTITRSGLGIEFSSEFEDLKNRLDLLTIKLYNKTCTFGKSNMNFGKNNYSFVIDSETTNSILFDTQVLDEYRLCEHIPRKIIDSKDDITAFIRGAFFGGGSLSFGKGGYFLEFHFPRENIAIDFIEIINSLSLAAKLNEKNSRVFVTLREVDDICDTLAYIGASKAVLDIQTFRVDRSLSSQISRENNAQLANLNKTITASQNIILSINKILQIDGMNSLDKKLKDAALSRLEFSDLTMQELADKLDISKSGLAHRLKKIVEIANQITDYN